MKRVLLVSEARAVGGAEIYLERLAGALQGWEAVIAVPERPALARWRDRLRTGGIAVMPYAPGGTGWWRLGRRVRNLCDLVHVNLPSTYDGGEGLLAWVLARASGRPVVVTEHLTELGRSRRRRAVKLATAGAVRTVITVSEAGRRRLVGEGLAPDRVVAIANGVPDPGSPPAFPAGGPRVTVLATLEPRKGIDVLLRAAAAIPGAPAVDIAGDGPQRASLESLAASLGLGSRVVFHGRVEEPNRLLGAGHVLALPSRLEAMPLSVLEAKAAGRGALVSALPGLDEIVRDGVDGRLLPPGDVDAWAGALAAAAAEPAVLEGWGRAARAGFEARFTLAASAAATAAVYERARGGG